MDNTQWIIICIFLSILFYFLGKFNLSQMKFKKNNKQLEDQEMKELRIYNDEKNDYQSLKTQLVKERESSKKIIGEYEQEINYLKGEILNIRKNYDSKIVFF